MIKALTLISQFEVAFVLEKFTKKSKLRHVGMQLTDTVSNWWLAGSLWQNMLAYGRLKHFSTLFYEKFFPLDFKEDMRKG